MPEGVGPLWVTLISTAQDRIKADPSPCSRQMCEGIEGFTLSVSDNCILCPSAPRPNTCARTMKPTRTVAWQVEKSPARKLRFPSMSASGCDKSEPTSSAYCILPITCNSHLRAFLHNTCALPSATQQKSAAPRRCFSENFKNMGQSSNKRQNFLGFGYFFRRFRC